MKTATPAFRHIVYPALNSFDFPYADVSFLGAGARARPLMTELPCSYEARSNIVRVPCSVCIPSAEYNTADFVHRRQNRARFQRVRSNDPRHIRLVSRRNTARCYDGSGRSPDVLVDVCCSGFPSPPLPPDAARVATCRRPPTASCAGRRRCSTCRPPHDATWESCLCRSWRTCVRPARQTATTSGEIDTNARLARCMSAHT
jgi:hypothetical protein